ncbi:MAG: class I SAM-dependent methyltransferase, partial [Acidimicrobiia bacterium]|nr:class I SAM-dependent methyltransferase [Acidimicrobiia bacterium]
MADVAGSRIDQPPPPPPLGAGEARPQRLVFGEDAELYDRARPAYPVELVDELIDMAGGVPLTAVDVGCGTGKATVLLAARGVRGVGVEPDPAMAAIARRNLAPFPGWLIDQVSFERFIGPSVGVDLVVSAQAWHWLTPGVRVERAWEVLRPGGWLALWWNRSPRGTDDGLRAELDECYRAHAPQLAAREPGDKGRPPTDELSERTPFGPAVERAYHWSARFTSREYCDLLETQSDHRLLEAGVRARLFDAITAALDARGGGIELPYRTELWAVRRPA